MADCARRRRRGILLGFAVSLLAVGAAAWWASRQPTPRFPTDAGALGMVAGAVGLYGLATLVRGWRWHVILRRAGVEHHPGDAVGLTVVGYMGNTVLPARGGEVLRVVIMGARSTGRRREVLGSILAERLLDVVTLVTLFAVMTWVGVAGSPAGQIPALLAVGACLLGAFAATVCFRARRRAPLRRLMSTLRPVTQCSRLLVGTAGLGLAGATAAIWLVEGMIFALVGAALGLPIGVVDGAFLVVLGSFSALVPAAPGYLGTYDAAMLFGLAAMGFGGGDALAFAVLVRFVLFVPITAVGLVLLVTRYARWRARPSRPARVAMPRHSDLVLVEGPS